MLTTVHISHDDDCDAMTRDLMVLTDMQGAIASQYATNKCPYTIRAPAGQRVNVTVTDFSRERLNMSSYMLPGTHVYQQLLVIKDGADAVTVYRERARTRMVLQSRSNVITLLLKSLHTPYLVEYKGKQ